MDESNGTLTVFLFEFYSIFLHIQQTQKEQKEKENNAELKTLPGFILPSSSAAPFGMMEWM